MLRLTLKLMLVLGLSSIGIITFVLARPYDDSDLRAFFSQSGGCPLPCWQGIRPGVTSADHALAILEQHPWVERAFVSQSYTSTGSGFISWRWSGQQPAFVDAAYRGELLIHNHLIWSIRIHTVVPFGNVWLMLNRPQKGNVVFSGLTISAPRQYTYRAAHRAIYPYPDGTIQVMSTLTCPLRPQAFWEASVEVQLYDVAAQHLGDYDLAAWFQQQPVCDERQSVS